ncbi:MAG: bifunctional adenosylcobinamide kinase/adenosylcobinamide-phosphate guanylyltransferase [Firmicutes bacterium]|nr:bifunctional adenosylcobinamide kinase/adenosylcobinamide-phosphate guanylyltransferase [Bacillota bacterium]
MEEEGRLVLVTGGARSGKSRFAEELAARWAGAGRKVVYLATAGVEDSEMRERVQRHRERRPAHWVTVEETHRAEEVIREIGGGAGVILLDCLTLLLSNWLLNPEPLGRQPLTDWDDRERIEEIERDLLGRMESLARTASEARARVIVVSSEVGMGLVPEYPLGRVYRDLLGLSNQAVAARADQVYAMFSGIPVKIKG